MSGVLPGASIKALVAAKSLDADWVTKTLGWTDTTYRGFGGPVPAIQMPYLTEDGTPMKGRYRVGVDGPEKFRWETGAKASESPYGLQFLHRAEEEGRIILVEGETDFATLSFHRFPAMGVPGATLFSPMMAEKIAGLKVYLWKEPDQGGLTFLRKVLELLPEVSVISTPEAKDACELARLYGDKFPSKMGKLIEEATLERAPTPNSSALNTTRNNDLVRVGKHWAKRIANWEVSG